MELRLVIPASPEYTGATEVICNRRWRISSLIPTDNPSAISAYHCISYSWGAETAPALFSASGSISSRTRGALEAVVACCADDKVQAFWLDAVCVPDSGLERRATLESMGFIYKQATSVIVVLSDVTFSTIEDRVKSLEPLTDAELEVLEKDRWVLSVWTYQELMNASVHYFTTYNMEAPAKLAEEDFFNVLGFSLEKWKQRHGASEKEKVLRLPGLNALEDAVAQVAIMDYKSTPSSALADITGMHARYCDPTRPTNRLYALFGVLTQDPCWGPVDETMPDLVEAALEIWERKGDFSFIYTANPRRSNGQTWRPEATDAGLVPILSWNSWGGRQTGSLVGQNLVLQNMIEIDLTVSTREPEPAVVRHVSHWMRGFNGLDEARLSTADDVRTYLLEVLQCMGWTGSGRCRSCPEGFAMIQSDLLEDESLRTYISSELRWRFGNPGIATVMRDGQIVRYSPVVFVGKIDVARRDRPPKFLYCNV